MRPPHCTLALALLLFSCVADVPDDAEGPDGDVALRTTGDPQSAGFIPICMTTVNISNVALEVPPVSGSPQAKLHQRAGLTYVAGQYLDVVFTLQGCPIFSGVQVDGAWIPDEPGIDGADYSYDLVSDTPLGGGAHRTRVRLWIDNPGFGTRHDVKVFASNALVGGAKSVDIAWVGVEDIGRESKVSISAAELRSKFASGSYRKYGDSGWSGDDHDFDYQALAVSIDSAIHLHIRLKHRVYSTPWACDYTATVDGTFHLSRNYYDEIQVDWIKPNPNSWLPFTVTADDDNFCTLAIADVVAGVKTVLENTISHAVKDEVAGAITGGFSCDVLGDQCGKLFKGFDYKNGELIAVLDEAFFDGPAPGSLTVRAPYVVSAPAGTFQGSLPVPPEEHLLITQEGLVNGCASDVGNASTCNGTAPKKFGGAGLFNWSNKATWPVPDPYEYGSPPLPQREKALAANAGLVRTPPSQLPAPGRYVSALLARVGDLRFDVSRPCAFEAPAATATAPFPVILLGRNERANSGAPYGSGEALVTVRFSAPPDNCATW